MQAIAKSIVLLWKIFACFAKSTKYNLCLLLKMSVVWVQAGETYMYGISITSENTVYVLVQLQMT